MPFEYQMLVTISLLFLMAWLPSSVAKLQTFGSKWVASNRNPIPGKELSGWGARAERAHHNLKDNLPAFIVAILVLGQLNKFDNTTYWLSLVYVIARIVHFASYSLGHVLGRAIGYLVALICNVWLLVKVWF